LAASTERIFDVPQQEQYRMVGARWDTPRQLKPTFNLPAEILSWSRFQGLFAGIALEGATLRQDLDDSAKLYGGRKLENREIVTQHVRAPKSATRLLGLLNKYSRRENVETTSSR
jgi:Las17-binding protein actin regulator